MRNPAVLILALLVVGCASTPVLHSTSGLTVTSYDALPPPALIDLSAQDRPYFIGPFDKLSISVFGVEALSQKVQADASGRISMPLVGVVEAAGKTPDQLASAIEDRLRGRYVRNPEVIVNLEETVSQVITVDGQVREPGLYPVVGQMTLMRAVATAKGTTEFAKLDDVVIFRTVNNQRMAALYNLKAIRKGVYNDPEVFANDVVVVGDSAARRLFKDALQGLPLLTTPLVVALQNR
ncbi:MAG: polysaccharide export protein [Sphingomonas sp. SCN 67-18]|uniref:polysaccharide biosynthesis/export family protein n=1 Tax=uncultured Sphingomonas sp. TaxID=158754 RepID=UPI00086D929D|nr:polysaccharide biosynthesis/export family protein [Sphingomonas sp. SCN 67-18]ODU22718.1 MAG: polysaccharide export protein [Sphingomonas sp. SCN 67-18]